MNRIKEILPNYIGCSAERGERVEVCLCHPNTEGGVLLSERLSGGNGGYAFHGLRRRFGVDEDILVVATFACSGQFVADIFAETELEKADEEGGYQKN